MEPLRPRGQVLNGAHSGSRRVGPAGEEPVCLFSLVDRRSMIGLALGMVAAMLGFC
jgi:hypothetical protein